MADFRLGGAFAVAAALVTAAAAQPARPVTAVDRAIAAIAPRVVTVRRGGRDCPDCLVSAVPVAAVEGGGQAHCLTNPIIESVEVGPERRLVRGALVDIPVRGAEERFVRVLLMARDRPATAAPPAIHSGTLCLPGGIGPDLAFARLGADRDGPDRGIFAALLAIFGSYSEQYIQIYVQSFPSGAEIRVGGQAMPTRTDAPLALKRSQLPLVWLVYGGRRYPLAACRTRASVRSGVAREYSCRVN